LGKERKSPPSVPSKSSQHKESFLCLILITLFSDERRIHQPLVFFICYFSLIPSPEKNCHFLHPAYQESRGAKEAVAKKENKTLWSAAVDEIKSMCEDRQFFFFHFLRKYQS
jgi:hypothetical protein